MTAENLEILEELLKCPICCDYFKEPRSLPCSHAFCLGCLQRQEDTERTKFIKTCPICRQEIQPQKKASKFPPAFMLQQIADCTLRMREAQSNQGERRQMVDRIFKLFETRKQLKQDEELRAKQSIESKKEEITKKVDEAVEKIKQYVDSRRKIFLTSIDAECKKRLEKLSQYSQDADMDYKIKSWVISNIDDDCSTGAPLKPVLSAKVASLAWESEGNRAVDSFLKTLDLNVIRQDFSGNGPEFSSKEAEGLTLRSKDDNPNARGDAVGDSEVWTVDAEEWGYLRSEESCTPRINNPVDSAVFPLDQSRSVSDDSNTRRIDSVHKDPSNVVSVTPYIVNPALLEGGKTSGSDYSHTEGPAVFPCSNAATSLSEVKIEHWEKAPHQNTRSNAGGQHSGLSQQRGRVASAPVNSTESSEFTKPLVSRVWSVGAENNSVTGMWRRFGDPVVLRSTAVQDMEPSKRLCVHVNSNYTVIAAERGTKMWVFMNSGSFGRRRHVFDAVSFADEETRPTIIGIASLPNDNGWCMLLKNTVLVFDYHGVLDLRRSFPDTSFLAAVVYSSNQFVFIDKDLKIGIAGFSRDNVDEFKFLRTSRLQLTGDVFSMAIGPNVLFIAHTDSKRNVGTIACLSGLGSHSLDLSNDHEIHAPRGFDCPQSICCDQNGKLFALWRDKDHTKSVIVEYTVDRKNVISNIVFDKTDRVRAITCNFDGRLVTCSV